MPNYRVRWELDISAKDPLEAAEIAQRCMPSCRLDSKEWIDGTGYLTTATMFEVFDGRFKTVIVDLTTGNSKKYKGA